MPGKRLSPPLPDTLVPQQPRLNYFLGTIGWAVRVELPKAQHTQRLLNAYTLSPDSLEEGLGLLFQSEDRNMHTVLSL